VAGSALKRALGHPAEILPELARAVRQPAPAAFFIAGSGLLGSLLLASEAAQQPTSRRRRGPGCGLGAVLLGRIGVVIATREQTTFAWL
jgi:hypothetical protein